MERPRTGPMQFPGEIQPGVYLDHETARAIFTGNEQLVLGEIRNALQGIQPVQQARLEKQSICRVYQLSINEHGAVVVRVELAGVTEYLGVKPGEFRWGTK